MNVEKKGNIMNRDTIVSVLIEIIANTYGIDPEELSPKSHLVEDVDLMGNLDEYGKFIQRINQAFELELRLSDISIDDDEGVQTIADLAALIEDAMLG